MNLTEAIERLEKESWVEREVVEAIRVIPIDKRFLEYRGPTSIIRTLLTPEFAYLVRADQGYCHWEVRLGIRGLRGYREWEKGYPIVCAGCVVEKHLRPSFKEEICRICRMERIKAIFMTGTGDWVDIKRTYGNVKPAGPPELTIMGEKYTKEQILRAWSFADVY